MNRTLYHLDAYHLETKASVIEVLEIDGQYHLRLDQTLFYPEGGGQPCDTGTIDSIPVRSVYENEEGVYHVLEVLPHTDRPVPCHVDAVRRMDFMQQHTGQHLLSAVMDHLYDAATVGFRMTDALVTIDLDKRLEEAEILAAEAEANRLIWSNLAVKAYWPDADTLAALPLRKQPKVAEDIRILEIDGYDYSPCCGTHVRTTGELGIIKVLRFENYKSGVRLEFLCGRLALQQFRRINDLALGLSRELSAPVEAVPEAFARLKAERDQLKEECTELKKALQGYEADALLAEARTLGGIRIVSLVRETDMKELKNLASRLVQTPEVVALFGSSAGGKGQILFQRSAGLDRVNLKTIFDTVIPLLGGKGGGSPSCVQGGGDSGADLEACLVAAEKLLNEQLGDN